MLRKIISIRNVGRFRNSAAVGNPEFSRHTLILGANGTGKTTLCAVLRSLKTGDSAHISGRRTLDVEESSTVELLFSGCQARFDGETWSTPYRSLAIFDGVFVTENVHSGEVVEIDHRRNLYRVIIGEEGVRLAEQEASLARKSRQKTGEITAVSSKIQDHILAGMRLDGFLALPADAGIDARITEQERTVESVRQVQQINSRPPPGRNQGFEVYPKSLLHCSPVPLTTSRKTSKPISTSTLLRTVWSRVVATGLPGVWSTLTARPAPSAARILRAFL